MTKLNLNIDSLLKPITKKAPSGVDIRQDTSHQELYYEIKDARQRARDIERQSQLNQAYDPNIALPEWEQVIEYGLTILSKYSKDLEVCAWLIEAYTRTNHLQGFIQSITLTHQLAQRFWSNIHPQPDEKIAFSDIDDRVMALAGLNGLQAEGSLIEPLKNIPLTQSNSKSYIAFWQYKNSLTTTEPTLTQEDVKQSILSSGKIFYEHCLKAIDDAIKAYQNLSEYLDIECGQNAPPTQYIVDTLQDIKRHFDYLLKESPYVALLQKPQLKKDKEEQVKTSAVHIDPIQTGTFSSRQEALDNIKQIAQYFEQNEPHSPIAAALSRTVLWGGLSFTELMDQIIKDGNAKEGISQITGATFNSENRSTP